MTAFQNIPQCNTDIRGPLTHLVWAILEPFFNGRFKCKHRSFCEEEATEEWPPTEVCYSLSRFYQSFIENLNDSFFCSAGFTEAAWTACLKTLLWHYHHHPPPHPPKNRRDLNSFCKFFSCHQDVMMFYLLLRQITTLVLKFLPQFSF